MSDQVEEIKRRDRQSRDEWGDEWGDDQERVDRATLLAEVERLREQNEKLECVQRETLAEAMAQASALRTEVERLREALAFYADENRYRTTTVHVSSHFRPVMLDRGNQARKALEGGR